MTAALSQARERFIAGNLDFEAGRMDDAAAHFEAALALAPGRPSLLVNLAAARIQLNQPDIALPLLDQALAADPQAADAAIHRATALAALDRAEEALSALDAALASQPTHAPGRFLRARILSDLRRFAPALEAFEVLLQITPMNAQAWFGHAQTLLYLGRQPEALDSYERALALAPGLAMAWTQRGNILMTIGQWDAARHSFEQALSQGGDVALNRWYLAGLDRDNPPQSPPRDYVRGLFDDYASDFDTHLVGTLHYRGHEVLIDQLKAAVPRRFAHALDLGCGTGLCGPLLRAVAQRVDGVDLSEAMLDQARARQVYEGLTRSDLLEHLQAQAAQQHDLILASDVFIYVGALDTVFEQVQRVLCPDGVFCFSVEQADAGGDLQLRQSLRYAHSESYLRDLAQRNGLRMLRLHAQALRQDQGQPVAGWYAVLTKG